MSDSEADLTPTRLEDLVVGDLFYWDIIINIADLAQLPDRAIVKRSHTTTAKKILRGQSVRRICLVLVSGKTSIQVTYLATFKLSSNLPANLDKTMWYPIAPAMQEGLFTPLPALSNGKAIRTKHTITVDMVDKLPETVSRASTTTILAAMRGPEGATISANFIGGSADGTL